jgi:hypothetical protein
MSMRETKAPRKVRVKKEISHLLTGTNENCKPLSMWKAIAAYSPPPPITNVPRRQAGADYLKIPGNYLNFRD